MTFQYDQKTDHLKFPSGKSVYCFGGNPSIALGDPETVNYGHGSDGGFSIICDEHNNYGDIRVDDAIALAEAMIQTWIDHKAYLERRKAEGSLT